MSKFRLLHQPRPMLYDSGVVSRVLDDVLNPVLLDFAATHAAIAETRAIFVSQTTLFELQPVVRVLKQRFPRQQRLVSEFVEDFDYLPLSEEIGQMAISLKRGIEQLKFADATIAATAIVYGLDLFTLNEADFAIIPGLRLYKPANYHELLVRLGAAKNRNSK